MVEAVDNYLIKTSITIHGSIQDVIIKMVYLFDESIGVRFDEAESD